MVLSPVSPRSPGVDKAGAALQLVEKLHAPDGRSVVKAYWTV